MRSIMKPIKIFRIGSIAFFKDIENFEPKDIDELAIMDSFIFKTNIMRANLNGKDVFFCRNMNKEEFIKDALESKVPMRIGKFLVPEFAEYLKLTIDDLKSMQSLIDQIDDKHEYEKIIYNYYLENNDFVLTDEQRAHAFEVYKSKKK